MPNGRARVSFEHARKGFTFLDYLRTWKMTQAQVEAVFYTARCLEEMYKENIDCKVFNSGLAVSNFRDNSTRSMFLKLPFVIYHF